MNSFFALVECIGNVANLSCGYATRSTVLKHELDVLLPAKLLDQSFREEISKFIKDTFTTYFKENSFGKFERNQVAEDFLDYLNRLKVQLDGASKSLFMVEDILKMNLNNLWKSQLESHVIVMANEVIFHMNQDVHLSVARNCLDCMYRKLLVATDPRQTLFVPKLLAWFDVKTKSHLLSVEDLCLIGNTLGPTGFRAIDQLLAYRFQMLFLHIVSEFRNGFEQKESKSLYFESHESQFWDEIGQLLSPFELTPNNFSDIYSLGSSQMARRTRHNKELLGIWLSIGQAVLLRTWIRCCALESAETAASKLKQVVEILETDQSTTDNTHKQLVKFYSFSISLDASFGNMGDNYRAPVSDSAVLPTAIWFFFWILHFIQKFEFDSGSGN